ncbi:MAG: hypothetical protein J1F04_03145 [Oscillospiraceae bacterium]|nr:hypothetical protein [Oscillospiraceae bacterium]
MENYTAMQKELIGALVGLARSLDETNSDFSALNSVIRGLKAIAAPTSGDIEAVRSAKQRAVPDCSTCQNPCGKTFDYDLDELKPETSGLKYQLIDTMARYAKKAVFDENNYKNVLDILAEGLFAVGYDYFNDEQLKDMIRKVSC